jgi:hypothetical protein
MAQHALPLQSINSMMMKALGLLPKEVVLLPNTTPAGLPWLVQQAIGMSLQKCLESARAPEDDGDIDKVGHC